MATDFQKTLEIIFKQIDKLIKNENYADFMAVILQNTKDKETHDTSNLDNSFSVQKEFLLLIISNLDDLADVLTKHDSVLISVKNQKSIRTCFQLITSFGIAPCLIPGLGISLSRRCSSAVSLAPSNWNDEQKYEMLVCCTDFFTRSYKITVFKTIIMTFHLSDYLALLIQLSFAPIKKPGIYGKFIMTPELFDQLNLDRKKYIDIYEQLMINCFQPALMKEFLVLQSVTNPSPPTFLKRIISKEMSRRLLAPDGLLSLIRCFIESYGIDTGFDWKKIDMVCKIILSKHGNISEDDYLCNICSQVQRILNMNNNHYLVTGVACILSLDKKFHQSDIVKQVVLSTFKSFDSENLVSKSGTPGTIIMSPKELVQKINILHACGSLPAIDYPAKLILPNLYTLFLIGLKCTNNEDLSTKLKDILLKCLESLDKNEITIVLKILLFGKNDTNSLKLLIYEYEAGIAIKYALTTVKTPKEDSLSYFLQLIKASPMEKFTEHVFEVSMNILIDVCKKREISGHKDLLFAVEDEPVILNETDEQYVTILHILSEISMSPKVINALKTNPSTVTNFVEYFILKHYKDPNDECVTIALVLLNTILSSSNEQAVLEKKISDLIPALKIMSESEGDINNILSKEVLSLIQNGVNKNVETMCEKAIADVFDDLLPVRAHGIISLTKLIESKDPEAISKKHYIFCIFQEQLKTSDSYIYLSAINGIASLGAHCTEDVLHVLCSELLHGSLNKKQLETNESHNHSLELRMKVGDVIVKITKRLGEVAVVHKTLLLNTILCACRDEDPLIRTSALSNLAEIAEVLHYRIGSIIYEVLLCVWSVVETDKAIECRRAAVMVISSLFKGLGKEALFQLKEELLPIYRTLKNIYSDYDEDSILRLHAQIALEELNDIVKQFVFPEIKMNKRIFVLDKDENIFK